MPDDFDGIDDIWTLKGRIGVAVLLAIIVGCAGVIWWFWPL